jgi:sarcosine oxidase
LDWGASDDGAWVRTETATYRAATLIIAAGAWAASVLSELDLPLQVRRKTLWWLAVDDPDLYAPERFPVFIADSDLGQIYGFPVINGLSLKIADHAGGQVTSADLIQPPAVDKESLNVRSLATSLFPGVTDRIVDRSVCLYTMTPDAHFVVDRHPSHGNVVVACGFSGHGFKFAPAIGELAARLADNPTEQTPPILSIDRLLPLDRLDPR